MNKNNTTILPIIVIIINYTFLSKLTNIGIIWILNF